MQRSLEANAAASLKERANATGVNKIRATNKVANYSDAAKQANRYYESSRKSTSKYMKKLSEKYTIKYDVLTGQYSLYDKNSGTNTKTKSTRTVNSGQKEADAWLERNSKALFAEMETDDDF